ncbi:Pkinase-domain-containing protein [Backusella circina FSU 941]|nr:Pkinase-domain-containing protein [Backusella circina FSU 941]
MIIKEIGRGMHGKVKLAQDLDTGELVAIKIVDKQSRKRQLGYSMLRAKSNNADDSLAESEQKIRREIAILKKCAHPHVVKLKEVIDDISSRKIYLALEFMEGGEIIWRDEDEQPVLSIDEARGIFRHVVSGLDYLHYQGIIHRDIKPANLLLSSDLVVKISDFGVSYFNQQLAGKNNNQDEQDDMNNNNNDEINRELAETAGTPAFFAPEMCCITERHVTKAIDIWALGVTLYCLLFGQCPFTAATEYELFDIIPTAPLTFPCDVPDEDLKDVLYRLLEKDPKKRITLEEVKHHPWVIADLQDPSVWWEEADPTLYKTVQVTDEEVTHAVTLMDRLRKSIRRLSSSLSNITHGFSRNRSKSISHNTIHSSSTSDLPTFESSHLTPPENPWIPTSFTNTTLTCSSSEDEDEFPEQQVHPFHINRNDSSESSMSGLVVTFSRPDKSPLQS